MKNRRYMLCQFPNIGFGSLSGKYYLLDRWGNRFPVDVMYSTLLDDRYFSVKLSDKVGGTYSGKSLKELLARIELETDSKIVKW